MVSRKNTGIKVWSEVFHRATWRLKSSGKTAKKRENRLQSKLNIWAFIPKRKCCYSAAKSRPIHVKPPQEKQSNVRALAPDCAGFVWFTILGLIGRSLGRCCQFWILPVGSQQRILRLKFKLGSSQQASCDGSSLCPAESGNHAVENCSAAVEAKNTKMIPGSFRRFGYQRLPGLECSPFLAASMIKFPILVAFFQDVDAGKFALMKCWP